MILDFKISNYKSFMNDTVFTMVAETSKLKSANIHRIENSIGEVYRTSKVSVIYGPNASGKSNLLSALTDFIYYIVNQPIVGSSTKIYKPFFFEMAKFREPTKYELVFLGPDNIRYEYIVVAGESRIIEEKLSYYPEKRARSIFKRKSTLKFANVNEDDKIYDSDEHIVDKKTYSVFSHQLLLSKFGEEPHPLLSRVYLYFRNKFNLEVCKSNYSEQLRNSAARMLFKDEKLREKVKNLFIVADTKIIDLDLEEVEDDDQINYYGIVQKYIKNTRNKKVRVQFGHQVFNGGKEIKAGKGFLPHDHESKGTQTLFTIGTNLFNALNKGQILIVDELDSSLHPSITKMLVQLFLSEKINKNGAQLIFNTHDVTLLDEELFRKDQIWITEKNEMGVSELYSLSDFDGLREDTPFEKWYMAGKFGGLPAIPNLEKIFAE